MMNKANKKKEENFFDGLDMLKENPNFNIENEEFNFNPVGENKVDIKDNDEEIQKINEKTTKKIKKKISKKSTANQTMPTKSEIIAKVVETTNLLELENRGITLSQKFKEEIKNEMKKNDINDNKEYTEEEEEEEEADQLKKEEKNENENSDSLDMIEEESEEVKNRRKLIIEKMTKKYDEFVDDPEFDVFDESKISWLLDENDSFNQEK